MSGWYELSKNAQGLHHFVLKAANGLVILRSETYATAASARGDIASVQVNAPHDERYTLQTSQDGKPYFNLKAANGEIIGTSQMYVSSGARQTGIDSVKTNGPSRDVREV